MKTLAIIPARGGSKRIPRKNVRLFMGQPIIKYSIDAAFESQLFDEVMVSTDDQQIASISARFNATIPFMRSEATSDDYATTADVLLEVLLWYAEQQRPFDYFCCIYPTAPLLTAETLVNGFSLLISRKADAVIPVVPFSYPIQRALKIENNELSFIAPENITARTQDLTSAYHDAGQFYWARVESFLQHKTLFMPDTCPLTISNLEVQDIDNEQDWRLAEIKYERLQNRKKQYGDHR